MIKFVAPYHLRLIFRIGPLPETETEKITTLPSLPNLQYTKIILSFLIELSLTILTLKHFLKVARVN